MGEIRFMLRLGVLLPALAFAYFGSAGAARLVAASDSAIESGTEAAADATPDAAPGLAAGLATDSAVDPATDSVTVAECGAPQPGWIFCDDFEVNRLDKYFEYVSDSGSFVRASGVGRDGSFGMRTRFEFGQVGAGRLLLAVGKTPQQYMRPADAGTAKYRELYWRFYVRLQPGWVGGGGDKLSRATVFTSTTSWAQAMIAHVWSGNSATAAGDFLMIDPARGTDAIGNVVTTTYNDFARLTWLGASPGRRAIFAGADVGQWHCIEVRVRLNDPGHANGLTNLWINGTLDAQRLGLNFLGNFTEYGLNGVFLENYWNSGSPALQERFIDHFVVSTQRIGCLAT